MKKLFFATAMTALALSGCQNTSKDNTTEDINSNSLILVYSQTGTTKIVAEELSRLTGAPIEEVECVDPYSGTYDETIERCLREMDENILPEVKPLKSSIADVDTIYLGFPVWFGTYARPIMSLVTDSAFVGKTIIPFATFGSGGLESSTTNLIEALPNSTIATGFGIRQARISAMPSELNRFLIENNYIAGEVTPLPDFGEASDVTDEDVSIFEQATGAYKFPLGTPVAVAKRQIPEGDEYAFSVNFDKSAMGLIYVIVPTDSLGNKMPAEFTRVIRNS